MKARLLERLFTNALQNEIKVLIYESRQGKPRFSIL